MGTIEYNNRLYMVYTITVPCCLEDKYIKSIYNLSKSLLSKYAGYYLGSQVYQNNQIKNRFVVVSYFCNTLSLFEVLPSIDRYIVSKFDKIFKYCYKLDNNLDLLQSKRIIPSQSLYKNKYCTQGENLLYEVYSVMISCGCEGNYFNLSKCINELLRQKYPKYYAGFQIYEDKSICNMFTAIFYYYDRYELENAIDCINNDIICSYNNNLDKCLFINKILSLRDYTKVVLIDKH